jgi:hypothetical protein
MKRTGIDPGAKALARGSTFLPRPPYDNALRRRAATLTADERRGREERKAAFEASASAQPACAWCGSESALIHAHHVIKRQLLERRGLDEFDPRGAVRLCSGYRYKGSRLIVPCHGREHDGGNHERMPSDRIPDVALTYMFDVLGPAAGDYLVRNYSEPENDPRLAPFGPHGGWRLAA